MTGSTELWIQIMANGLALGAAYALFASGLSIIFGVLEIVNFAHGEYYMLGGYVALGVVGIGGLGYWSGILLTPVVLAGVGVLSYLCIFRFIRSGNRVQISIIATLGVSLALQNGALTAFGGDGQSIDTRYSKSSLHVFGTDVQTLRVLAACVCLVVLVGLAVFLRHTQAGRGIQGIAQNPEAAAVCGLRPHTLAMVAIGVGVALTGVAAATLAPIYGVYPAMGVGFTVKAFAIVVIGGFGRVLGTAIAGLIVGMVESIAGTLGSSTLQDIAAFTIMLVVLLVRPSGLLGREVRVS